MSVKVITPPAAEPVPFGDLKLFLKVDDTAEDSLIASLAEAARLHLEALTGRTFVTQGLRIIRDAWPPSGLISLPVAPVISLDAVRVMTATGSQAVATTSFRLDGQGQRARIALVGPDVPRPLVPLAGIEIDVTAGYGPPAALPAPLAHAIRLTVAHWFENRTPVVIGHDTVVLPATVSALLAPFMTRRMA